MSHGSIAALPPVLHALRQSGVSTVAASTGLQRLPEQSAKGTLFCVFFSSLRTFPWMYPSAFSPRENVKSKAGLDQRTEVYRVSVDLH